MGVRRLSPPDRGVSPVVGTVVLVSLVTLMVALLGAVILGGTFYERTPEADLVFQEDDDAVHVAVVDAQGLSAGDTEIRLQREGSCGTWDGEGRLEKGDSVTIETGDCPEELESGSVIQVIGGNTLIDTYELSADFPHSP